MAPEAGVEAQTLLTGGQPKDVLISLINDLDLLAGPTVLALDDYHVIDAPEVHGAVTFLLDNLPPRVTLAMTTRSDPPLPLARLRARAGLLELRSADLRFTPEEAGSFLNDVKALALAPGQVAALSARTEGWATGLQLAAFPSPPLPRRRPWPDSSMPSPAATASSSTIWSRRCRIGNRPMCASSCSRRRCSTSSPRHDAMSPRYRLLLPTLVGTGLRWGEITAVQVMDGQSRPEWSPGD